MRGSLFHLNFFMSLSRSIFFSYSIESSNFLILHTMSVSFTYVTKQKANKICFTVFDWESAAAISLSSRKSSSKAVTNKSNLVHPVQPCFLSCAPLEIQ